MVSSYSDFRALDPSKYLDNVSPGRTATIVVAASNSSLQSKAQADFVCDGVSDEDEINVAIGTGRRVVLLEGTFTIDSPITKAVDNVTLEGQGEGTLIYLANTSNCNVITIGGNGWNIKNLKIDGNKANQTAGVIHGIYASGKTDGYISNVHTTNCGYAVESSGIGFGDSCARWRISSCVTENGAAHGIAILSWGATSSNFLFENCISKSNILGGFFVNRSSYVVFSNCQGISNGYCNWSIGEASACYSVSIVNCHSYRVTNGSGIRFTQSWYCSIVGCTSYEDGIGVARIGLHIEGGGHHAVIGNTVYGAGDYGLLLETYNAVVPAFVAIVGNTFRNTYAGGIALEAGSFVTITGNTLKDIGGITTQVGINLTEATDVTISGNTFQESRAGAARYFYYGVKSSWGSAGSKRIKVSNNIFSGMVTSGVQSTSPSDSDDWSITDNTFITIATGIMVDDGDGTASAVDWIIQGNRFDACTTPININKAGAIRTLVISNDWQGCTNNPSYGAAITPRFKDNIDKDGKWWNQIEHHTAADTLTEGENGSVHTNLGAGGTITLTLPQTVTAGTWFEFAVMTAQALQIDPGAAGAIYIGGAKQTDDKYIWADDEAESIKLVADGNGDWIALGIVGVWSVEA